MSRLSTLLGGTLKDVDRGTVRAWYDTCGGGVTTSSGPVVTVEEVGGEVESLTGRNEMECNGNVPTFPLGVSVLGTHLQLSRCKGNPRV